MCFIIFMLTIYFIFIKKIINTVIDIFNFMDFYSNCYLIVLLQRRSNSVLNLLCKLIKFKFSWGGGGEGGVGMGPDPPTPTPSRSAQYRMNFMNSLQSLFNA